MAKIERFEDLIAWQKARELTRAIYEVTGMGRSPRTTAFAPQFKSEKGPKHDADCLTPTR